MTNWQHCADKVNNFFKAVTSSFGELFRRLLKHLLKCLMCKHFRSCHVNKRSERYFFCT